MRRSLLWVFLVLFLAVLAPIPTRPLALPIPGHRKHLPSHRDPIIMEAHDNDDAAPAFADTTDPSRLREALEQGTSLNASERVCTVDAHNQPTPEGHTRAEMRLGTLWHRATYVVVRHEPPGSSPPEDDDVVLLVQRRSVVKDYCPGKLDPTPGGVVGFGESYATNATRELLEEMNIRVDGDDCGNDLEYLFSFPYEDDKVRVWGGFFEATYRGAMEDLRMQPEEVSEILRLTLPELRRRAEETPDDWMPDGLHAMKLYLQFRRDRSLGRKLLKGYSHGDPEHYRLRPKPSVVFFDCDDCLYFDGWQLAKKLTAKIEEWCTTRKNLAEGYAYELYKKHGTALKGLLAEGHMEDCEEEIDAYLADVHDVPVHEHLDIDAELRDMIRAIDPSIPKYIFTASVRDHAERCLRALGIEDLFVDIIDVKSCNLATKHSPEAFEAALRIAGVEDPETCIFLDDSTKNIQTGRAMGIRSFLVGRVGRDCGTTVSSEHAEHELDRIHDLPRVVPELFEHGG